MELVADAPFFISIAAPRKSGKTWLLQKCLEKGWVKRFDIIFVISPSLDVNGDYGDFSKYDHVHFIANIQTDIITEIFDRMYEVKAQVQQRERDIELGYEVDELICPEVLVILDDCIDSNLFSFRGSTDKVAERGRHVNLSCVVSSQRLSAISRSCRINSDIFLIFCPYQAKELEQFVEQFVFRDERKMIYEKLREIFDEPYRFLFIDNGEKNLRDKIKTSIADDFVKNKYKTLDLAMEEDNFGFAGAPRKESQRAKRKRTDIFAPRNKKRKE